MSFINYSSREINCKIVYYGPGLCGKTTNLQYVYNKTNPDARGKMISLATETERTLFFDFLPLSLGEIRGFKTRFHLYTVPGQVFYNATRKVVLKGLASKDTKVGDLMTANVLTVSPTHTIDDCMGIMTKNHVRHLPVVDHGKLVGLISIGDAVKSVMEQQQATIDQLSGYIAGGLTT